MCNCAFCFVVSFIYQYLPIFFLLLRFFRFSVGRRTTGLRDRRTSSTPPPSCWCRTISSLWKRGSAAPLDVSDRAGAAITSRSPFLADQGEAELRHSVTRNSLEDCAHFLAATMMLGSTIRAGRTASHFVDIVVQDGEKADLLSTLL